MKEKILDRPLAWVAIALLVGLSLFVVDAFSSQRYEPEVSLAEPEASLAAVGDDVGSEPAELATALNGLFVDLAERVTPGVVRIEVRKDRQLAGTLPQFDLPEPFRRFFELPGPDEQPRQPRPQIGGGTGFVISADGHIVTNHHVVGDAQQITVWLENRRSFEASLVGVDPTTDVAVIRIDAEDLPVLTWGSSDDLSVGEWVMAVGNPGLGGSGPLDYTVTTGIVSAKDRPLRLIGQTLSRDPAFGEELAGYAIENFIQTDAVINPGNSGGPLVNLAGEVVGINTAIASTSGYYQGYGFAVPADLARRVVEDLIEDGSVERAWLGVQVTGVTAEDAEVYGLEGVRGALVQDVTAGGPADEAGLRREDVILAVDGEAVERGGSLQQLIAERRPGERVALRVQREGKPRTLEVELGEAPISGARSAPESRDGRRVTLDRLGIGVEDMTPEVARRFGYEDPGGIVVTEVEPYGPGARRGVGPGLRILELDGEPVSRAREFDARLRDVEEGAVVSLLLETPDGRTRIANVRTR